MAYVDANMRGVDADPPGEQLFKYNAGADAIAAVVAADYFLPAFASKTLRVGDTIIVRSSNNGAVDLLVVNAATPTNVTVVNGT